MDCDRDRSRPEGRDLATHLVTGGACPKWQENSPYQSVRPTDTKSTCWRDRVRRLWLQRTSEKRYYPLRLGGIGGMSVNIRDCLLLRRGPLPERFSKNPGLFVPERTAALRLTMERGQALSAAGEMT